MSYLKSLYDKGLVVPPKWMLDNLHYETVTGSMAYGVSDSDSDWDICGFCIPPKEVVFPHLAGEILGFGRQVNRFAQYQQHHIFDKSAAKGEGRNYDFQIHSIVKYFQLCMENNPNMIDTLFTPETCVLHSTSIANMVRDNRKIFLHKGCWHKFKGYAYSQMHKIETKNPEEGSRRHGYIEKFGFDVKHAYHVVRLILEAEQILNEGDLDLQRNREQLKAVRRGEWSEAQIKEYFNSKAKELESSYANSKLPHSPDEGKIKKLLLDCLEHHYSSLKDCIVIKNKHELFCKELKELQEKHNV